MNNTAFIFDMDGTIIDSMPTHVDSWIQALTEFGHAITVKELHKNNLGNVYDVVRSILGDHLSDDDVERIAARKEIIFRKKYKPMMEPVEGLDSFLSQTRRLVIPTALATNAGWDNIDYVVDGLNIRDCFDVIIGGMDVQRAKPDPEMFLLAAERLNVNPNNCIAFEDSANGVMAAEAAGMQTVLVKTFHKEQAYDQNPAVIKIITDFRDMQPEDLMEELLKN